MLSFGVVTGRGSEGTFWEADEVPSLDLGTGGTRVFSMEHS